MTLRIGVLGASRIAELAIVGPAQDLGHRLVAVAARDPHRAALFAEKYGVERVLGSYDDVIEDPEVDIVYNPLANSLHGAVEHRGGQGRQAGTGRKALRPQRRRGARGGGGRAGRGCAGGGGASTTAITR